MEAVALRLKARFTLPEGRLRGLPKPPCGGFADGAGGFNPTADFLSDRPHDVL